MYTVTNNVFHTVTEVEEKKHGFSWILIVFFSFRLKINNISAWQCQVYLPHLIFLMKWFSFWCFLSGFILTYSFTYFFTFTVLYNIDQNGASGPGYSREQELDFDLSSLFTVNIYKLGHHFGQKCVYFFDSWMRFCI